VRKAGGEGWAVASAFEREAAAAAVAEAVDAGVAGAPAGGVVVLLDTSGSVSAADAKRAAGAALAVHAALAAASAAATPGTPPPHLAVLQFSHVARVEVPLGPVDPTPAGDAALRATLGGLQPLAQGTDVGGALAAAGAALRSGLPPSARRAAVLVTDGQFSAAGAGSLRKQAGEAVRKLDAFVERSGALWRWPGGSAACWMQAGQAARQGAGLWAGWAPLLACRGSHGCLHMLLPPRPATPPCRRPPAPQVGPGGAAGAGAAGGAAGLLRCCRHAGWKERCRQGGCQVGWLGWAGVPG
jgi:hypothetical protein